MRVAVIGAYGFIGSHVARRFLAAGHEVVGFGRNLAPARRALPQVDWVHCDLNTDTSVDAWGQRFGGVDVVVNCAGVLQRTARDDPATIHGAATIAMFDGAARAGVKRIVHLSALGADDDVGTAYAQTKRSADRHLAALDLDWIILRPSLVIAHECYGGTALIRSLAGLPGIIPLPGGGRTVFQPVAMDDLTEGILRLAAPGAPSRQTIAVTGPEQKTLAEILAAIRAWLGFPHARIWAVSPLFTFPALLVGDLLGYLGVESALRTTSMRQMEKPNVADPAPFAEATGIAPRSLEQTLIDHPATRADRRDARMAIPVTILKFALAFFWIVTGCVTLVFSETAMEAGAARAMAQWAGGAPALAAVFGGAALDIVLGGWLLVARSVRGPCLAQITLSIVYLLALTGLDTSLWTDPLGALVKVVPIMAATLVLAAGDQKR